MLNVKDHGVCADGTTLSTQALQTLIDRCAGEGGGTLRFEPGTYLTGALVLRSGMTLHLETGATLLGSPHFQDYPFLDFEQGESRDGDKGPRALLAACDATSIRVTGGGCIDGNGQHLQNPAKGEGGRPALVWFRECRHIMVDNLRLRNAGSWLQHYDRCEALRLTDLDVWNHVGINNDGIDIDGCRDVRIVGCRVDSGDDAICLKARGDTPTENVLVRDCITRTYCNHFKIGTESAGGFRNVRVEGLIMVASDHPEPPPRTGGAIRQGACGIALGCVDGGHLENISVRNITMDGVRVPFFIRLGERGKRVRGATLSKPVGSASNIVISGIQARRASPQGCFIVGLPDAPVRDVTVCDCDLEFEGGGDPALLTREIPERRDAYPAMEMFGPLPAWALFTRNVAGLRLARLNVRVLSPDARGAIVMQHTREVNVSDVRETETF